METDDNEYDATQQRAGTSEQVIESEEIVNIYQAEIEDFGEAISLNRKPYVSGEDGLWNLRVLIAAYESAKQGKAVKMP